MVDEKIVLAGITLQDTSKWYCNAIDKYGPRCADVLDDNGNYIKRIHTSILNGEEDWQYNPESKCYFFYAENKYYDDIDGGQFDPMMCSHFRWTNNITSTPLYTFAGGRKTEIQFNYDNGKGGLKNFTDWIKKKLSDNKPVQLLYIMKYPYYYHYVTQSRAIEYDIRHFQSSLNQTK